ncbi:MAG: GrpB family protein [Bacteroidetes bacterium]|nr:GrpB family protein [Bacteroidota bacterium]
MKVEIAPYNPEWKTKFEEEKKILSEILKELNPVIEHIGSTSVEGLGAKPVIDIQIGVTERSNLDKLVEPLIKNDYIYVKKYEDVLPDRRYFIKVANPLNEKLPQKLLTYNDKLHREKFPHLVHIHSVVINTLWWKRHIAFRDYLRSHTEDRDDYHKLKLRLAENDWQDVNYYADAKSEFVKSIEAKAGIYER